MAAPDSPITPMAAAAGAAAALLFLVALSCPGKAVGEGPVVAV